MVSTQLVLAARNLKSFTGLSTSKLRNHRPGDRRVPVLQAVTLFRQPYQDIGKKDPIIFVCLFRGKLEQIGAIKPVAFKLHPTVTVVLVSVTREIVTRAVGVA